MLQGIENFEREKALYDGIVLEYLELEDIVRNQSNSGGPYESTLHTAPPKVLAHLEWWWKCALRGSVLRYRYYTTTLQVFLLAGIIYMVHYSTVHIKVCHHILCNMSYMPHL